MLRDAKANLKTKAWKEWTQMSRDLIDFYEKNKRDGTPKSRSISPKSIRPTSPKTKLPATPAVVIAEESDQAS